MVADIRIEGTEKFVALSRALRRHGSKELRGELTKGITQATKPLKKQAKDSARTSLPRRGGLARRVARTSLPTKRRTGNNPGVRIEAKPNAVNDPGRIDRGRIKHPVFGRGPWVLQDVQRGWFTEPMEGAAPEVRQELVKVIDRMIDKIARTL